jgi:hypothetical protein
MLFSMVDPFTETALRTIAQNEMRDLHTMFALSRSSPSPNVLATDHAARLVWAEVHSLLALGHQLMASEQLEDHARAIPAENIEINIAADYCI